VPCLYTVLAISNEHVSTYSPEDWTNENDHFTAAIDEKYLERRALTESGKQKIDADEVTEEN
jgi:hypothetical protein